MSWLRVAKMKRSRMVTLLAPLTLTACSDGTLPPNSYQTAATCDAAIETIEDAACKRVPYAHGSSVVYVPMHVSGAAYNHAAITARATRGGFGASARGFSAGVAS